jgi:ubiquinone/menaquinone biosynthesis C-methylase UbiE
MNRERGLRGANSYTQHLGFDPLAWLASRARSDPGNRVAWLDLCCGRGRALVEAAAAVDQDLADRVRFVGVDLVDFFDPAARSSPNVELVRTSVTDWAPDDRFDLITCVHGLHYVGDKLGALSSAASRLTETGLLTADFELSSIRSDAGPNYTGQPAVHSYYQTTAEA